MEYPFIKYTPVKFLEQEMIERSKSFYEFMDKRRSVREFSDKDVSGLYCAQHKIPMVVCGCLMER